MSRKSKYHAAAFTAVIVNRSKAPLCIEDEWKHGEDTEISAPPADRPMVQELWALLSEVRTAEFFVEPEEKRLPVVQRINQIHAVLLRSRAIKGYVGGAESRQARRLIDSYGPKIQGLRGKPEV